MTPEMIQFGQLDALQIRSADGASAVITLYGAQVVSWKTADGKEQLFCSRLSALDGSKAIRGGIPIIYPQFAEQGTGQRHGFARLTKWAVEECGILDDGSAFGEFVLAPQDLKPELALQFPCRVALRVTIQGQKMDLQLQVDNIGKETVSAACALHTYFALDDTEKTQVFGFQGQNYVELGTPGVQDAAGIPIIGKVERQFRGSAGPLRIEDGTRAIELQQSGFPDAVVWNPGAADAAALADLGDEEYRHFVCVEPVTLQRLEIAAGQSWVGRHQLLISAKN